MKTTSPLPKTKRSPKGAVITRRKINWGRVVRQFVRQNPRVMAMLGKD